LFSLQLGAKNHTISFLSPYCITCTASLIWGGVYMKKEDGIETIPNMVVLLEISFLVALLAGIFML